MVQNQLCAGKRLYNSPSKRVVRARTFDWSSAWVGGEKPESPREKISFSACVFHSSSSLQIWSYRPEAGENTVQFKRRGHGLLHTMTTGHSVPRVEPRLGFKHAAASR